MSFNYPENIVVANFMFCKKLGREYCPDNTCICDHRMANNAAEDLDDIFADEIERTGFALDDRTPLNVFDLGAVLIKAGSEDYMCSKHRTKDCADCFDWAMIVGREIMEEERLQKWLEKRKKYYDRVDVD